MKQEVYIGVEHDLLWAYGTSIAKIKKDIEIIEKMGATHIDIDAHEEYGDAYVTIRPVMRREETDEEYSDRLRKEKEWQDCIKERELEELNRLKNKYGV